MAGGTLTSHHVNYLIWRYLQESGHGEAAVMLQRAWNPEPENLPFAPYIKTHALVSLVQKGLQYHDVEKSLDEAENITTDRPASYFGPRIDVPLSVQGGRDGKDREAVDGFGTQIPRSAINGNAVDIPAPGSKSRTFNVEEAGVATPTVSTMDVDRIVQETHTKPGSRLASPAIERPPDADGDVEMAVSHYQEPPSPIFTLTNGQSVGVQIPPPKVADLVSDTNLLDVASSTHVTKIAWRPGDAFLSCICAETYCGLWKLASEFSSAPSQEILVDGTNITGMEWESSGRSLAVATYTNFMGTVTIYNPQGTIINLLPNTPGLITGLRWSMDGRHIILSVSDGKQSRLILWNADGATEPSTFSEFVDGAIYDVQWSGEDELYACGDGVVYKYRAKQGSIEISDELRWEEFADEPWTFIKSAPKDPTSRIIATASNSSANIWFPTHDIKLKNAHHGDITSIDFRSQTKSTVNGADAPLVLASSSMDATVKLWNVDLSSNQMTCIHRLFLGSSMSALVSVFSPDGYAIAAASYDKLFVWNAERGGAPMGTYPIQRDKVKEEPIPDGDATPNGTTNSSIFDRPLSWDSDSKKLALGFETKIAIIDVRR